jgi:hypothetical protein
MKKFLLFLLVPAFFAACDVQVGDYKSFDYTLQGNWKTTTSPYHELEITLNTIKIMPYYSWGDVPGLDGYTRNVTLEGYSEKVPGNYTYPDHAGSLFIKNGINWTPVAYEFWTADIDEILTIGSGSQKTTFKKQ